MLFLRPQKHCEQFFDPFVPDLIRLGVASKVASEVEPEVGPGIAIKVVTSVATSAATAVAAPKLVLLVFSKSQRLFLGAACQTQHLLFKT